ncbi:Thiol-disulfide isomerase or thioredoxin [Mucilaginibacter pineti]|uniref:Thiol-disulfide isomerase or thioredoxin n=1 Tax=Mucilaginibacter pineti TaxID=1391627 RepID=A0A1G7HEN0_9SPHI|nr:TlpA disulfide reductase family protein [Mucilaginibacter pineti]SDE98910.1 Thiol-disulfide isomerase or thioredoxin [Mucilaginibacter pineti]
MRFYLAAICITVILAASSCAKPVKIHISGTIPEGNGILVKLMGTDAITKYDSVYVKNGRFEINTTVPETGIYGLDLSSTIPFENKEGGKYAWGTWIKIYAEDKGTYQVEIKSLKSLLWYNKYAVSSSSFTENKLNEYDRLYNKYKDLLTEKRDKYLNIYNESLDKPEKLRALSDTISNLEGQLNNVWRATLHEFAKTNNNTIIIPYQITQVPDLFDEYAFYQKTLNNLTPEVKQSAYYEAAINLLKSVGNIKKGGNAPPLAGNDEKGVPFDNNYKKDKLTLINFWASWCIPCREEIPALKEIYNTYNGKGFNIVSVSIDEHADQWKTALDKEKMPWKNIGEVVDQFKSKNIENFVVKSVPTSYLLNSKGEIVTRDIKIDSLKTLLKKELL